MGLKGKEDFIQGWKNNGLMRHSLRKTLSSLSLDLRIYQVWKSENNISRASRMSKFCWEGLGFCLGKET